MEISFNGSLHNISEADGRKLYFELAKHFGNAGRIGFNPRSMREFFEKYREKAARNIMMAVRASELPLTEDNVKSALAYAVAMNEPGLIAEVAFEAAEWAVAHAVLESIEE